MGLFHRKRPIYPALTEKGIKRFAFLHGENGFYLPQPFPNAAPNDQSATGDDLVTAFGQTMGKIGDISGNANNLTQATATQLPLAGGFPYGVGVRNICESSEDMTGTGWSDDGGISVTATTFDVAVNGDGVKYTPPDFTVTGAFTGAVNLSSDSDGQITIRIVDGSITQAEVSVNLTSTPQRFSLSEASRTYSAALRFQVRRIDANGDDLSGTVTATEWQLEYGETETAYQSRNSANLITQSGLETVPAPYFDGSNDFLSSGVTGYGSASLHCAAGQAWVIGGYFVCKPGENGTLASKAGATEANRTFHFGVAAPGNQGKLFAVIRGTLTLIGSAGQYDDYLPHVWLFAWDGATLRFYIDSITPQTPTVGSASEETSENVLFGARTTSSPSVFYGGFNMPIICTDRTNRPTTIREEQAKMKYIASLCGRAV